MGTIKSLDDQKLFELGLDMRMCGQGRKILLFVENAPSHPQLNLKNVHLLP